MKRLLLLAATLLITGCNRNSANQKSYIQSLERENNISYSAIKNNRAAYITSMCYTKVKESRTGKIYNPCYSCHNAGQIPNYVSDADLQQEYNFPKEILQNPYTNLFKDRTAAVAKISDDAILSYVRTSNYFDANGTITLTQELPKSWKGYRPDCYYNFDDEGFDHDPKGAYTGWRAYRYYPFLGTFWPTNGSTDDVLIRLAPAFRQNSDGSFDKETYALNLAIVETVVKQHDIPLSDAVDERRYGVDLNQNGQLDTAQKVVFSSANHFKNLSYVGKAKETLDKGSLHLAGGLFPEGTEFLHSVRYIDWDEKANHIKMASRLKELRYARKSTWYSYSELERIANAEMWESQANDITQTQAEIWQGNYEEGLKTGTGWVYQGFIEDKNGDLRPQTHEETINCMGCHAGIGATTDTTFSFARKFEGVDQNDAQYGWNHWSQKGLVGVHEPKAAYKRFGEVYEYSFYLRNNPTGNEFRDNEEVKAKFFNPDGSVKNAMLTRLHEDISTLLFPSKARMLQLDKGYRALVEEQSFIYGRDANVKPMENVFRELKRNEPTGIETPILRQR